MEQRWAGGGRREAPWVAGLLALWAGSRLVAFGVHGVRFDASPLAWYLQFVDPELLRTRLLESAFWLRDQPPGFNLFLGVVLKGAGARADAAFHAVYALAGAALVVSTWLLMRRLGALPVVAFAVAALLAADPVTVLYESWLFYTWPVTALLVLAALAMHRFVDGGRTADGAALFVLLAAVVLVRGTFHLAWFVAVLAGLALARALPPRRLAAAAALPCALLVALYVKNFVVFGEWFAGRVYRDLNSAQMVLQNVPAAALDRLIARGEVSGIARLSIYQEDLAVYDAFLSRVERTGIPVLDTERKSTGQPNWQSVKMQQIGRRMAEAAAAVARHHPEARRRSVRANLARYFVPAEQTFPFDAFDLNARALAGPLEARRRLLGQRAAGRPAAALVVGLPALLLYGAAVLWGEARNGRLAGARAVTVAFLLFTIAYLAAVTILFSAGDQNRYRFKVAPFYAVLAAMAISDAVRRTRARPGGARRLRGESPAP